MKKSQKNLFIEKEADAWFTRNFSVLKDFNINNDHVYTLLKTYGINPEECLEIGSSAGYRINALKEVFPQSKFFGIEPSQKAIAYGKEKFNKIQLDHGTIDDLAIYEDHKFEVVIIGFLLYVLDRELLFKAIAEADRVLKNGGYLIIIDFNAVKPKMVKYHHIIDVDTFTYKQNYESIFLSSCLYRLICKNTFSHPADTGNYNVTDSVDNQYVVSLLKKDLNANYR